MSIFLYNLFLKLYQLSIRLAARKGNKAAKWIEGRKDIFSKIAAALDENDEPRIWIHCASLGEFEQGRPIIEAIKNRRDNDRHTKIVLTFFSPSGYEIRKNYDQADYVFYLPMDGKEHAEQFINLIKPELAIFVKYEFWYHYLHTLYQKNIPTYLVSAIFRASQPFFKGYGNLFRKMLGFYTHIFLQDERSQNLLSNIGVENTTVAGDTRYDRVAAIAAQAKNLPHIERWKGDKNLLIAGSTWPEDEKLLSAAMKNLPANWKLIIAPHEIHEAHLNAVAETFDNNVARYSQLSASAGEERVLLINNIGMLSSIYRYGAIAFVGGGFGKGIHNILEAAIYEIPVFFGPNYRRFIEAREMVDRKIAFSVEDADKLTHRVNELNSHSEYYQSLKKEIRAFMKAHQGATALILEQIFRDIHI